MAAIPPNLARVPNLLASQIMLNNISAFGAESLRIQSQLSSGQELVNPSDDPIGSSLVSVLDERISVADRRLGNISRASSTLGALDQALADATDLAQEARGLAAGQVGTGSDADTRKAQAVVVDSLIRELASIANREFDELHLFAGDRTAQAPVRSFFEGFRYVGEGKGLATDLGEGIDAPVTVGADEALGALSARVKGDVDLDPSLTNATRLADVRGATGDGVSTGAIEVVVDNGGVITTVPVDLTEAENIGDVVDKIESEIRTAAPGALTGVFPSGVTVAPGGQWLALNVAAGFTIDIRDAGAGTAAEDLGLAGFTYDNANSENTAVDLDPRLTSRTTLGDLGPATPLDFGDIVFRNGTRQGTVTIDPTMTIEGLRNAVAALDVGVRIEIGDDGRRLDVVNAASGLRMSVEEAGAGPLPATTLGIRTLRASTELATLNDGRGVEIADGAVDAGGAPDPDRNVDFEVTLTDGSSFIVDLTPADAQTMQTVIAKINADAAAAGLAGVFNASLSDGANGIEFQDTTGGGGAIQVRQLNGRAADDLGLLDGSFTPGPTAVFAGEDRATVRVDSLFTALLDLRQALETDDSSGITFAAERIDASLDRLASTRAVVGGRAQRVEASRTRIEDTKLLDQKVRGEVMNLDFAKATSRLGLLGFVRQAGLTAAAQSQSQSLLDFLG